VLVGVPVGLTGVLVGGTGVLVGGCGFGVLVGGCEPGVLVGGIGVAVASPLVGVAAGALGVPVKAAAVPVGASAFRVGVSIGVWVGGLVCVGVLVGAGVDVAVRSSPAALGRDVVGVLVGVAIRVAVGVGVSLSPSTIIPPATAAPTQAMRRIPATPSNQNGIFRFAFPAGTAAVSLVTGRAAGPRDGMAPVRLTAPAGPLGVTGGRIGGTVSCGPVCGAEATGLPDTVAFNAVANSIAV
jgi:hypothetical protein